ncbi:MAG TPA: pyridoxamine 5'-phosphate oxidase [Myxococcaceae bacterium]|nr:pyridoxamine 5'-phosphate oxidase [Myxococcaceae bacterium]
MEGRMMDPFEQFAEWFREAEAAVPVDPNSMVLSTVGPDGRPSSRVVLLKGFDRDGFVFYGNLDSRKFRELRSNPFAALNFHWKPLEKQVRIEGRATQVSDQEADAYFATRPRGSQIGAWASRQSEPLASRAVLEAAVREVEARHAGRQIPRPPHWSGFRLDPDLVEFWKAAPFRLHDRELFRRASPDAPWTVERLYP